MASLAISTALRGLDAISSASLIASRMTCSGGNTLLISPAFRTIYFHARRFFRIWINTTGAFLPHSSACLAVIWSPVRIISMAFDFPMARVSRWVPPPPWRKKIKILRSIGKGWNIYFCTWKSTNLDFGLSKLCSFASINYITHHDRFRSTSYLQSQSRAWRHDSNATTLYDKNDVTNRNKEIASFHDFQF